MLVVCQLFFLNLCPQLTSPCCSAHISDVIEEPLYSRIQWMIHFLSLIISSCTLISSLQFAHTDGALAAEHHGSKSRFTFRLRIQP